jgi:hypothetical protein
MAQRLPASLPSVTQERRLLENSEEEPVEDRAPKDIAETLRTDPRGTQKEDRARVWTFLQNSEGWNTANPTLWLLGADEALGWLRGAEQVPAEVETGLCALVLAPNLPASLREYALQHLGLWAEEHTASPSVLDAFKQAFLLEQTSRLAGIALTVLYRSCFGSQETMWIQKHALQLASSTRAQPVSRAAALQVLALTNTEDAEPIARSFLSTTATIDEKIAALQVLRRVGTPETLGWLAACKEEREPLTAEAQRQTLQTLRARWTAAN